MSDVPKLNPMTMDDAEDYDWAIEVLVNAQRQLAEGAALLAKTGQHHVAGGLQTMSGQLLAEIETLRRAKTRHLIRANEFMRKIGVLR